MGKSVLCQITPQRGRGHVTAILYIAVVDAGIVERGLFYCIARKVHAKNLAKTTPVFDCF